MSQVESYPRLTDKIILITGASAGIGEACARVFAASGSKLVLGARREDRLVKLKSDLETQYRAKIAIATLDVCSTESVNTFLDRIPSEFRDIDILVNNAGLALGKDKTWETPEESVDLMIDTNVKGAHRMIRLVVPGMKERNRGHIINISSIAGKEAYAGGSIYCASKFALEAINISLRKELVDTPIRVTSIGPGLVSETEFSIVRFFGDKEKASLAYQGYKPLSSFDIADNVAYVASRPEHVQIADIIVFPSSQASSEVVHKKL